MVRPCEDPRSIKRHRLVLALSADELKELLARAELANLPLSRYVRMAAVGERLRRPVPAYNRQAWAELSRLAGNLAQLLHAIRAGVPVGLSPELVREAYALARSLRLALLGGRAGRQC